MATAARSVNFEQDDVHTSEPLVSKEEIRERVRKNLHLHIGRGRRFSVDDASLGSGVPKRCIQAAMAPINDESYRPLSLENMASLDKFLGAAFASARLELSGLGTFELMDGQQPPLPRVLNSAPRTETVPEKRKRLLRELQELEDE